MSLVLRFKIWHAGGIAQQALENKDGKREVGVISADLRVILREAVILKSIQWSREETEGLGTWGDAPEGLAERESLEACLWDPATFLNKPLIWDVSLNLSVPQFPLRRPREVSDR